jgi:hypothetical protein
VTIIKAPYSLGKLDGMQFVRDILGKYDLSMLSEIKVRHLDYEPRHPVPDAHGNAKRPRKRAKTRKARETYRISLSIRGYDKDLPWDIKDYPKIKKLSSKYGLPAYPGQIYSSLDEMLVFIAGHELYHFLGWTKQLDSDPLNERAADEMGQVWVEMFKERNV